MSMVDDSSLKLSPRFFFTCFAIYASVMLLLLAFLIFGGR